MTTIAAIPAIRSLPLNEKLFVMEALWEDLSSDETVIDIPDWHKEILRERKNAAETGTAKFIDWEIAKEQIRSATHENRDI